MTFIDFVVQAAATATGVVVGVLVLLGGVAFLDELR